MSNNTRYSTNSVASSSNGSNSLYQKCIFMLDRLSTIPGYRESYLDPIATTMSSALLGDRSSVASSSIDNRRASLDPVQIVWNSFRQGAGLCYLVNLLSPRSVRNVSMPEVLQQQEPAAGAQDLSSAFKSNSCKKNVYQVLVVFRDPSISLPQERMFTLSDLYLDDTNGFVKVLKAVEWLLERLEDSNLIPKMDGASRENSWYLGNRESISSASAINTMGEAYDNNQRQSTTSAHSGGGGAISSAHMSQNLDHRSKVMLELMETERKYVNFLEELQEYMQEAVRLPPPLMPRELISQVFANLDQLVDFQRKFLIDLENALSDEKNEGCIGRVFVKHEDGFSCYQQFCSNQKTASALVIEKKDIFSRVRRMDPLIEVPSYLIKPVQRICKYPLLLNELVKVTPLEHPDYNHLLDAISVAKHMAELVNESHRKQENLTILADLKKQVEDWKNHDVSKFGDLLLEERLKVASKDVEKELHVFLFEKIIVMFKETVSNSILKKRKSKSLQLRGNIYLREVTNIQPSVREGNILKIFWAGDQQDGLRSFGLKFRNEEILNQWANTITELLPRLRKNSVNSPRRKSHRHSNHSARSIDNGDGSSSRSRRGSNAGTNSGNFSGGNFYEDGSYKSSRSSKSAIASPEDENPQEESNLNLKSAGTSNNSSYHSLASLASGEFGQQSQSQLQQQYQQSQSQSQSQLQQSQYQQQQRSSTSSRSLDRINEYNNRSSSPKSNSSPTRNPGPPPNMPLPPVPGLSGANNFSNSSSRENSFNRSKSVPHLREAIERATSYDQNNNNVDPSAMNLNDKIDQFARMGEKGIIRTQQPTSAAAIASGGGVFGNDKRLFSFDSDETLTNEANRKRGEYDRSNGQNISSPSATSTATSAVAPPEVQESPVNVGFSPNQIKHLEDEFNELLRDAAVGYNNNAINSPGNNPATNFMGSSQNNQQRFGGLPPPPPELFESSTNSNNSNNISSGVSRKVKLHLQQDIYVLTLNFPTTFREMQKKIQEKLEDPIEDLLSRMRGGGDGGLNGKNVLLRIRYKDEDGDFVTINGDDDVTEWMEQQRDLFSTTSSSSLHFYITLHLPAT